MLNSKSFSDKYYSPQVRISYYIESKIVSFNKIIKMLPKKGRILDIGCFDGYLLEKIISTNGKYEVFGVDASKESVKFCQEKGLKVFEADVEKNLPFEDNFFDAVIGIELIEHLADTDAFILEVKRVLKKDGVLLLATPNFFSLARRIMTLFGINPYFEASFTYPPHMAGHLRFYTHDLLRDFLIYHNFHVIENVSDVIHLSRDGRVFTTFLAEVFPKLGRGVLIKAQNNK